MLNINIGGVKGWEKVPSRVRRNWQVLDIAGHPRYRYDLNSGEAFPFKDCTVDNYYCSHTLEHIRPENIQFVLEQILRTLKPSGLIRVVVPDVALALIKYVQNDTQWFGTTARNKTRARHHYPETLLGYVMLWFYSLPKGTTRSGHNTVFDWSTLAYCFNKAGFRNIRRVAYNENSAVFRDMDFLRHRQESLYMEAQK